VQDCYHDRSVGPNAGAAIPAGFPLAAGRQVRRPLKVQAVANLKEYAPDRADEYWEYAMKGAEDDLMQ
jgi:hypothetical protein